MSKNFEIIVQEEGVWAECYNEYCTTGIRVAKYGYYCCQACAEEDSPTFDEI